MPYQIGSFSLGIGNTDTTGSNWTGIPIWGIIAGDHTKAYYRDEDVIRFLARNEDEFNRIKNYQHKVWEKMRPKTQSVPLNNSIPEYKGE
ncbi:hypothetical protein ACERCG_07610 [Mannheimia sp. E30BD]|uniref:hypothetical protein n=1 Tax=Mannheimia sp. E30BD TaxID=3278708 RepID=UPI00359E737F